MTTTPTLMAPSILSADFARLGQEVRDVSEAGADWIHLDVMDGHFVPNITFGPPLIKALRPHSDKVFDAHLMIDAPDRYLEEFVAAGADLVTVHAESTHHLHRTLARIRDLGAKCGVAYNPATPLAGLEHVIDLVDLILIMSVNPGFGGQSFIPSALEKIAQARALAEKTSHPIHIQVDGGIKVDNIHLAVEAGADVIVAGSAVFGSSSYAETIDAMKMAIGA